MALFHKNLFDRISGLSVNVVLLSTGFCYQTSVECLLGMEPLFSMCQRYSNHGNNGWVPLCLLLKASTGNITYRTVAIRTEGIVSSTEKAKVAQNCSCANHKVS
uniref:Uncharacterized protein n=1 Tax=Anguilla anguilla TaxID=7936 RepID=A0A0E9SGE3_ANGAN